MELTRTAIQRPVLVLMAMLAVFLLGFIAYKSMRVELNPDVSFGVATVTTVYPGAGPEEVNTLVSKKLEDAVSGIANLQEVVATSQEGVSSVTLTFEVGTNMDVAIADVRTKVDAAAGVLPKEVLKPVVDKFDFAARPVMTIAMQSERLSAQALRDLLDNKIKDKFGRIKGVAQVGVNGGDQREIQVRVRRDGLVRYGIGIVDLERAIQAATVNVPSGRVVDGAQEYTVRLMGEFKTVQDIEGLYLSFAGRNQGDPTRRVRLGDIATVRDTVREVRSLSRLDGKDAVVVVVQKTKQGNPVEIAHDILSPLHPDPVKKGQKINLLQQIEAEYGITSVVTSDTSKNIQESMQDLNFTLVFGILLVAGVVMLFLHDIRGTLIVGIAIPVCIFAALMVMQALGFTINNMSMLALSLAVGVLVDDAIVVLENIYRHLKKGEEPAEAALNGRSEIGLAAIAITMADVVVFLPIGNMGGVVGQFFRPLGIGYAVCVLASLVVSFTITPMLASRWYKAGEDIEHPKKGFAKWFEARFDALANGYRRVLRASLRHRWYMFGGGFAALFALFMMIAGGSQAGDPKSTVFTAMAGTAQLSMVVGVLGLLVVVGNLIFLRKFRPSVLIGTLLFALVFPVSSALGYAYGKWKGEAVFKGAFIPSSDDGEVSISVVGAPDASLGATDAIVRKLEQIAQKHPETEYVVANVGTQGGGFSSSSQGTQYGQVLVTLREKSSLVENLLPFLHRGEPLRKVNDTSVVADLTRDIGHLAGAQVTVGASGGMGFGAPIQLAFKSDDRVKLLETVVKVRDALQAGAVKGVISPDISSKPGKQELRAVPNRARIAEANVSPAEVGAAMRMMYEGDDTVKFREKGTEYPVRVMMDQSDRDDLGVLQSVPVAFRSGTPIYLSEIATIERGRGVDKITRRDRLETIVVSTQLLPGFAAGTVQEEINGWLTKERLVPDGIVYKPLGQADTQAREMGYIFSALGIGLVLVYMILASLFDNLLYPAIIMLAQPQAMIGALLALVITDKSLSIVGMIGIIALVGLVGKNAILLVDYTNTLRSRGEDREEALVESGGTRLRPILMTTLALLFGMMPVALALGRGSEFRETIGITIIGGTLLSTVLTLLVIPCSYSIFDDMAARFRRRPKGVAGG